jgi:hypothetical protein
MASEIVTAETLLLTYEDYRQLPDDGKRYELVDWFMKTPDKRSTHHV